MKWKKKRRKSSKRLAGSCWTNTAQRSQKFTPGLIKRGWSTCTVQLRLYSVVPRYSSFLAWQQGNVNSIRTTECFTVTGGVGWVGGGGSGGSVVVWVGAAGLCRVGAVGLCG